MLLNRKPSVSIIVPVFNRPVCLRRSLASIIKQKYTDWELIIVDDGSSDDIQSVVLEVKQKIGQDVIYIRQENQGPGCARGIGLLYASGKFIQYVDSDDEILPEKIEKQVQKMEENPNALMCYCPTIQHGKNNNSYIRIFSDQLESNLLKGALEWRRWSTSSCLWRYPEIDQKLWSDYYNGEDLLHDVTAGIRFQNRNVVFVPEPMVIVNYDENSISNMPNDPVKFERYKQAILEVKVVCYNLLCQNGLIDNPFYSNPISERFFHSGLLLLKMGDNRRGLEALKYCNRTSKFHLRNFFSYVTICFSKITDNRYPKTYNLLFRSYKRLIRREIHFGRSV